MKRTEIDTYDIAVRVTVIAAVIWMVGFSAIETLGEKGLEPPTLISIEPVEIAPDRIREAVECDREEDPSERQLCLYAVLADLGAEQ